MKYQARSSRKRIFCIQSKEWRLTGLFTSLGESSSTALWWRKDWRKSRRGGRRGRWYKQLLGDLKEKEKILESAGGSTSSRCLKNSLWKLVNSLSKDRLFTNLPIFLSGMAYSRCVKSSHSLRPRAQFLVTLYLQYKKIVKIDFLTVLYRTMFPHFICDKNFVRTFDFFHACCTLSLFNHSRLQQIKCLCSAVTNSSKFSYLSKG